MSEGCVGLGSGMVITRLKPCPDLMLPLLSPLNLLFHGCSANCSHGLIRIKTPGLKLHNN